MSKHPANVQLELSGFLLRRHATLREVDRIYCVCNNVIHGGLQASAPEALCCDFAEGRKLIQLLRAEAYQYNVEVPVLDTVEEVINDAEKVVMQHLLRCLQLSVKKDNP